MSSNIVLVHITFLPHRWMANILLAHCTCYMMVIALTWSMMPVLGALLPMVLFNASLAWLEPSGASFSALPQSISKWYVGGPFSSLLAPDLCHEVVCCAGSWLDLLGTYTNRWNNWHDLQVHVKLSLTSKRPESNQGKGPHVDFGWVCAAQTSNFGPSLNGFYIQNDALWDNWHIISKPPEFAFPVLFRLIHVLLTQIACWVASCVWNERKWSDKKKLSANMKKIPVCLKPVIV